MKSMPTCYRFFLLAVGLFGLADLAPKLMILRATTVLETTTGLIEASRLAAFLYLIRNIAYAVASFPIGAFSNKFSRSIYLSVGMASL